MFADRYVDKAMEFRRSYLAARDEHKKADGSDAEDDDENDNHRYVLLHEMAKQTGSRDDRRDQILHVFLAGRESSATMIGNAVFHLCRNPEMWKNLNYLQYIIK